MKCHVEIETHPNRVFVRLFFQYEALPPLSAGALTLHPAVWKRIRRSLQTTFPTYTEDAIQPE